MSQDTSPAYLPIRKHGYDQEKQDLVFLERLYAPRAYYRGPSWCEHCHDTKSMSDVIFCFDEKRMLLCRICKICFFKHRDRGQVADESNTCTWVCHFCDYVDGRSGDYVVNHINNVHLTTSEYISWRRKKFFLCPCASCEQSKHENALPSGAAMRKHIWQHHVMPMVASFPTKDQVIQKLNEEHDRRVAEVAKLKQERLGAENAAAINDFQATAALFNRGLFPFSGDDQENTPELLSRALAHVMFHAMFGHGPAAATQVNPAAHLFRPPGAATAQAAATRNAEEEDDEDEWYDVDDDEEDQDEN